MYFHLYLVEQPISGVTILAATGSGLSDAALTLGSLEDRNLEDQCHIVSAEPLVPTIADESILSLSHQRRQPLPSDGEIGQFGSSHTGVLCLNLWPLAQGRFDRPLLHRNIPHLSAIHLSRQGASL
jgi:hypothetical protein